VLPREDLVYRQVVTLRDGARVLIRPLTAEDKQALLNLFLPVPNEEARNMRHNINDPAIVSAWAEHIDYERIFPLIAIVGDRIVGCATLHFNQGTARHRAEIRIFLAKDFRRRGLGSKLIHGLVEIGRRRSLYMLEVQVISSQVHTIKALQTVGFQTRCVFDDYFILQDGELCDVVYLTLNLRKNDEEF
jgi:L-amino acid N-acyltransferase YncA